MLWSEINCTLLEMLAMKKGAEEEQNRGREG
jgi:hypothetical protein